MFGVLWKHFVEFVVDFLNYIKKHIKVFMITIFLKQIMALFELKFLFLSYFS